MPKWSLYGFFQCFLMNIESYFLFSEISLTSQIFFFKLRRSSRLKISRNIKISQIFHSHPEKKISFISMLGLCKWWIFACSTSWRQNFQWAKKSQKILDDRILKLGRWRRYFKIGPWQVWVSHQNGRHSL